MPRSRLPLVAAVYLGTFVALLDVSIVNVALPTLQRVLATDLAGLQWVVDAYTLCLSAFMLSAGVIGDRYGRKRSWLIGVGVFTVGSALCASAPDLATLIAGRVVQGVAGALLIPGALSILVQAFPDERQRAHIIGGWVSFAALCLVIGPILGGILVDTVGWRSIFLINLPIGLFTLLLGAFSIGESADPDHAHLDLPGQLLSILWLGALTFCLIEAGEQGWTAPRTVLALSIAAIGLACFLAVEARSARPMLPLVLFRDVRFAVTNVASFALGFSSYASIFLYSLFLQQVQGWSPTETGLRMAPLFLTQIVVAPFTGKLTGHFGHAPVMIAGYLFIGLSMLMLSRVDAATPFVLFGALLAAAGVGNGLAIPSTSAAAMASTPRERSGIASAIINATRQSGAAIGIALLGALMNLRATDLMTAGLHGAGVADAEAVARAAVSGHDFTGVASMGEDAVRGLFTAAYAGGFQLAILVAGVAALLAAGLLLAVRLGAGGRRVGGARQDAGE